MLFYDAYLSYLLYIENRQKEQSKCSLKERFKNVILPYFKNMDLYKIKKSDYIIFQNNLVNHNYSYNYIANIHYLLVAFFNYCMKFYGLDNNIFKEVGNIRIQKYSYKKKYYTQKEFNKFIKEVKHPIYKMFFKFMYLSGTRPGEAMALKFNDIKNNTVSINKTISEHKINGTRVINTPKTMTSIRNIRLPMPFIIQLKHLKKHYKSDSDNLFVFGGLKPLAPTTINRYKKKACKQANILPITLHGFRHSHATMLLDHNLSIKSIQNRLGHSSTSTTTSIYLHETEKQQKRVLKALNLVLLSTLR